MYPPSLPNTLEFQINDLSQEFDEVKNQITSNFNVPHDIRLVNQQGPVNLTLKSAYLRNSMISYFNYRAETEVEIKQLTSHYVIEIPLGGSARTWRGKDSINSHKGMAVVVSPGTYFKAQWSRDCTKILILIKRELVEREISSMLGKSINAPIIFDMGLNLETSRGKSFSRTIQYVINELVSHEHPSELDKYTSQQLEQLLTSSLIINQASNYSTRLREGRIASEPHYMKKAEEFMRDNCDRPITIDELSRAAGISTRNLFTSFRKYRGISPLNHFNNMRFERVHDALKKADMSKTVSDIAIQWGFNELGRFSTEYKKRYGESPSSTLKQ